MATLQASLGGSALAASLLATARNRWRVGVLLRGAAVAAAAAVGAAALLLALDLLVPLAAPTRSVLRFVPVVLAMSVVARTAVRARAASDARAVALLLEERMPTLGNRLLTSLETLGGGVVAERFRYDAERHLAGLDVRGVFPLHLGPALLGLTASLVPLVVLATLLPGVAKEAWQRWSHPTAAYESAWREARTALSPGGGTAEPAFSGLDELRWRLQPPEYTGLPPRELRDVDDLTVLEGSRVEVRGRFRSAWKAVAASRVRAEHGSEELAVSRSGGEWSAAWVAGAIDRGVTLEARSAGGVADRRVIALTVEPDRLPAVALSRPDEDMVFAAPRGRLPIRAVATDDFGVAELRLSWIRTRGSGESYSFEEGEWSWDRLTGGGRELEGEFTLDLAAIDSRPGDVLHVRATARDGNTVTGPGEAVSETRVLRIALPDEMHTVTTLVGAPLELEQHPLLSQRMLILLTERLRDRAPTLSEPELRREANEIAEDQGRLRSRVGEQIFTRSVGGVQDPGLEITFEDGSGHAHGPDNRHDHGHEAGPDPGETEAAASAATGTGTLDELGHRHDEAPILDVDRSRMRIYDAMWAAERALRQAEPGAALPHQYEALRLIQEARSAVRVFARGAVRAPLVDVEGVRGTGKLEDAAPARRTPIRPLPSVQPHLAQLDSVRGALLSGSAADAPLGLAALAARLLAEPGVDPRAAALVSRATAAARAARKEEAARLLLEARSLLAPTRSQAGAAPVPSAADPAAAEYLRRIRSGPS